MITSTRSKKRNDIIDGSTMGTNKIKSLHLYTISNINIDNFDQKPYKSIQYDEIEAKYEYNAPNDEPNNIQINTLACEECNYVAIRKYELCKHIKQVHNIVKAINCNHCAYTCLTKV